MSAPLQARTVTIGRQTLRYVDGGRPGATRTLLLFNGIGASIETAASFIAGFKSTRV